MAVTMESLINDIEAETADLRSLIAELPDGPAGWDVPTPATGWAIRDQISHLAFFDDVAVQSATEAEVFTAEMQPMLTSRISPDMIAERYRSMPGFELLSWFDGVPNRATGTAQDFCLLVTQRRHLDDTELEFTGPLADQWLSIAQAFAGPLGGGRPQDNAAEVCREAAGFAR